MPDRPARLSAVASPRHAATEAGAAAFASGGTRPSSDGSAVAC